MSHDMIDMEPVSPPGDLVREELKKRSWTQADLAKVLGISASSLNSIILGKQAITPEIAVALGTVFNIPARQIIEIEFAYRRSLILRDVQQLEADLKTHNKALNNSSNEPIEKRKKIFEIAPIKEMQKRGWIRSGSSITEIEHDVLRLLEINSLDEEPVLNAVMRRSCPTAAMSISQRAWSFRVRQIAKSFLVGKFEESRWDRCVAELKKLASYSQGASKVATILANYGVRFVIVEPLGGIKIDGITTWLDAESPVIGMSIRYDRLDCFWHTLCHECSHVRHKDAFSIDSGIAEPGQTSIESNSSIERRADTEAAATLIARDEMESFIKRVGPLYSKERINQFANRIKVHPGIIVGQLQRRGEVGWTAHREMLVKIRQFVTSVAVTDGWGSSINPRVFE